MIDMSGNILRDLHLQNPRFRDMRAQHEAERIEAERIKAEQEAAAQKEAAEIRKQVEEEASRMEAQYYEMLGIMDEFNSLLSHTLLELESLDQTNYAGNVIKVLAVLQPIKNTTLPRMELLLQSAKRDPMFDECYQDVFVHGFTTLEMNIFNIMADKKGINDASVEGTIRALLAQLVKNGAPEITVEVDNSVNIPEETLRMIVEECRRAGLANDAIVVKLIEEYGVPAEMAESVLVACAVDGNQAYPPIDQYYNADAYNTEDFYNDAGIIGDGDDNDSGGDGFGFN